MSDIFDKKSLTERDICTKFITPAVVETAAWARDTLEARLLQAEADSEKVMIAALRHVLASISESSPEILAGTLA